MASHTNIFVCQVNLAKVPPAMQVMVGYSGLLQVFQDQDFDCVGDWCFGGFTRIIPESDFGQLVPFSGPSPEELDEADKEGTIDLQWIGDWEERVDIPIYWDDFGDETLVTPLAMIPVNWTGNSMNRGEAMCVKPNLEAMDHGVKTEVLFPFPVPTVAINTSVKSN